MTSDKSYANALLLSQLGLFADASDQNDYVNSNDGNLYLTGHIAAWCTTNGGYSVTTSTAANVPGMSVNVGGAVAQRYIFHVTIGYQAHTGSTDNPYLTMGGTVSPSFFFAAIRYNGGGSDLGAASRMQTTATFGTNTGLNGGAMASLDTYNCFMSGLILVPGGSGGTLVVSCASSSTAGYLISEGSFMLVQPV